MALEVVPTASPRWFPRRRPRRCLGASSSPAFARWRNLALAAASAARLAAYATRTLSSPSRASPERLGHTNSGNTLASDAGKDSTVGRISARVRTARVRTDAAASAASATQNGVASWSRASSSATDAARDKSRSVSRRDDGRTTPRTHEHANAHTSVAPGQRAPAAAAAATVASSRLRDFDEAEAEADAEAEPEPEPEPDVFAASDASDECSLGLASPPRTRFLRHARLLHVARAAMSARALHPAPSKCDHPSSSASPPGETDHSPTHRQPAGGGASSRRRASEPAPPEPEPEPEPEPASLSRQGAPGRSRS